ncbi:leucine-rich repeat-containing protein 34-like [Venturia canescens]|uniref:leucine-rich repeat-containing protein 34-like n=1 Tax=Venturia canescens TaxID=32260 RepID=UPI001C9C4DEA|nr:leucine-rich repeat-containing protein 34-like [Venturia canescens]
MLDALSLSIERFRTLTTIKLPNCHINAFGISQIGQMLKGVGCVRDLNLDMNPNIQENYYLLCSPSGNLRYLSLKYCNIGDTGIGKIADELKYRNDQSPKLLALNVANNRFGDEGARKIGQMLHTNRSLQSLVLTGNRITDLGAEFVIQELCM